MTHPPRCCGWAMATIDRSARWADRVTGPTEDPGIAFDGMNPYKIAAVAQHDKLTGQSVRGHLSRPDVSQSLAIRVHSWPSGFRPSYTTRPSKTVITTFTLSIDT